MDENSASFEIFLNNLIALLEVGPDVLRLHVGQGEDNMGEIVGYGEVFEAPGGGDDGFNFMLGEHLLVGCGIKIAQQEIACGVGLVDNYVVALVLGLPGEVVLHFIRSKLIYYSWNRCLIFVINIT